MDEQVQEFIRKEISKAVAEAPRVQRATVNAKDAAVYLGVHEQTLMEDVHRNKVPHTKIRNRYVFHLPTLDKWMEIQGLANAQGHIGADRSAI